MAKDWPPPGDLHRPDVEDICRKFLNLRYQLLPYIYSTASQANRYGIPMMRAMWLMYPEDKQARLIDDSYFWGDQLLVAPICKKDATEREVYLPAGLWWNYWTSESREGGMTISAKATLDLMPLFVKAGAIMPIGPVKQHAEERMDTPTLLRVYPGANGKYQWYEDAGDGFAYEKGEFSEIVCEWNDEMRFLTLTRSSDGKLAAGGEVDVQLVGGPIQRVKWPTKQVLRISM